MRPDAGASEDGRMQRSNVLVAPVKSKSGIPVQTALENSAESDCAVFDDFVVTRKRAIAEQEVGTAKQVQLGNKSGLRG